jgi:hypothetical protein
MVRHVRAPGFWRQTAVPVAAALIAIVAVAVIAVALRMGGSPPAMRGAADAPSSSGATPAQRHGPFDQPASATASAPAHRRQRNPFGSAGAALAASHPGTLLAAVYDISTGTEWTLGHGPPQPAASVVKLDIIETLLARYHVAGSVLPDADLPAAQRMMELSDNAAATALWFAAGGPREIAAYNASVGLRRTALSQCVDCPGFGWPGWGLSSTTPEDQIVLLWQLISPLSPLTASQRRYVLRLMEHVTPAQRWGVSGGVPPGVSVALKNGWLPLDAAADDWQVNSVGWISGDGHDYLMAVLTTGNATEQDGIDLIGRLSGIVWRGLS